jgi:hypothetical protein
MRERDAELLRGSHVESYCRNAPTAKDFEQLVDPDAKAPANRRRSTPKYSLAGVIDGANEAARGG